MLSADVYIISSADTRIKIYFLILLESIVRISWSIYEKLTNPNFGTCMTCRGNPFHLDLSPQLCRFPLHTSTRSNLEFRLPSSAAICWKRSIQSLAHGVYFKNSIFKKIPFLELYLGTNTVAC